MSNPDRNYDEKRDFIRMRMDSHALIHTDKGRLDALCIDLSSSGMQLKTEAQVAIGEQVEVEIVSQHSQLSSLRARGEVVRMDSAADGSGNVLGIVIHEMK